jgi:quercetin dioxygenase-like cupin family protein
MRLVSPSRRAKLVAGAATAAVGAAMALSACSALGDGPAAAGTPRSSAPSASPSASTSPSPSTSPSASPSSSSSSSSSTSAEPIVTPLAAALVPGPIDIDRRRPSNVVSVRIDFKAGDTTGWHSHPGPVLVQVVAGALTLRHAAHGRCLTEVVRAGHGFFEVPGAVHVAENRRPAPAVLYATFVLPPKAGPDVSAPIPAPCR